MPSSSHILVAGDDPSALDATSGVLREQGYTVAVSNGDAYAGRRTDEADLVVLEVASHPRDAYAMLSTLKRDERLREVPVVVVSPNVGDETTERLLGIGAADHVRRPYRPRELLARVQAQLRLRAVVRATREALRESEAELRRVRDEADSRRKLIDILHEVTGDLSADAIYHILARRVARALALTRCSIILAKAGDRTGIVATAFDNPALHNVEVELTDYPEIQAALESGRAVLVDDLQTSPMHARARARWEAEGVTVPIRSVIALPFSLDQEHGGVFFLRREVSEPTLTQHDVEFADEVIRAAVTAIQRARTIESAKSENARLEVLAHTDALTQVLNRRAMTDQLTAELDRARRYRSTLTLLMLDLDHFKSVNDTRGHLVGDDVLREAAQRLVAAVRGADIVARYGGEEFVVALPETSLEGAMVFAERIRTQIAAQPFVPAHGAIPMTVSIGIAEYPSPGVASVDELFARADEALYRAKAAGRNRVSR